MNSQPANFVGEFHQLFSGLRKLETTYEIKLNLNVKPVSLYTPRKIHHSLLPKVKNETGSMLRQGVISPLPSPQSGAPVLSLSQNLMGVYGSA